MNGRAGARCFGSEKNHHQFSDLAVAKSHGRGSQGVLLLFGRGELDSLVQPFAELPVFLEQGIPLLYQRVLSSSASAFRFHSCFDFTGVDVYSLAAQLAS
jgi:hypothetical protein